MERRFPFKGQRCVMLAFCVLHTPSYALETIASSNQSSNQSTDRRLNAVQYGASVSKLDAPNLQHDL